VATDLETAATAGAAPAATGRRDRRPLVALAFAVLGAFALYGLLSLAIHAPRVHPDELRYLLGASSLVEGEGLTLRGQSFGFGPLLSLMLAAIILVAGSIDAAYDWFKIAEALVFALTAVPVYLLARRLVSPWWAVLAASLSIAIPSSVSVATIMTESLSFLTTAWALYAIAVALERPTVLRQFLVLVAIGFAVLARTQFGILYVTWVVALGLLWLLAPWSRPRTRADAFALWPTALPVVIAPLAFTARLASGDSASSSLGAYWSLWRGYDPLQVVKWFVYHLADFTVYLAVVPVAVAPIVLWQLGRAGRVGSRTAAAFVALFASANVTGLLVVAAFASTPWGYDRLHDRYAFYLVPLWLVGLVVWLGAGLPRPVVASVIGAAVALVLPLVLPFAQLANDAGIDTVPGALWLRIESALAGHGHLNARLVLLLFVLALLAGTFFLRRRFAVVALPLAIAGTFAAMSWFAWERIIEAPEDKVFAGGLDRAWIDDRIPHDARVTKLYIDASCGSSLERHALFLTEFFNETVDRAVYVNGSVPDGIPLPSVDVTSSGLLELAPGTPLRAEYVFTQPGLELEGRRIAEGTAANLVLWRTEGPVRVVGASSNDELRRAVCRRTTGQVTSA
jgi:hypothetical protein